MDKNANRHGAPPPGRVPPTPRAGATRLKQRTWGPARGAERARAGGDAVCTRCHAVRHRKRWTLDPRLHDQLSLLGDVERILCAGCAELVKDEIEGIVTVQALWNERQRDDLINMLRHEEEAQRAKDPRSRIASIVVRADGLELTTTTEFLARHLARSIAHAGRGSERIHQSPGEKFVQIEVACPD